MKLINNNPYRILGLLSGTKASEQSRQIKRLKQFIEAQKEPDNDFSFPILGDFSRTLESIADAEQKINLDSDKIDAALFWFYNGNAITDEPAFNFLTDGNIDDAKSIWLKLISTTNLNERNSSAFHNLSTLLLCNNSSNELDFEQGIVLKLQLLESEFYKKIVEISTDITYKATKNEIQLLFLNQLKAEFEKGNNEKKDHFIQILNKQTFVAKENFFKSVAEKPIKEIENRITETITKRKADKSKSTDFGRELFDATQKELSQIKEALGVSNPKFITISDKLANEILQCGIDYFNHYYNTDNDPGDEALDLCKIATTFARGNIVKQRCENESKNIQIFVNRKPERDKQKRIKTDITALEAIISNFRNKNKTIADVQQLLTESKPILERIKTVLGSTDDLYLKLSSIVATIAQSNVMTQVNVAKKNMEYLKNSELKRVFELSLEITKEIGKLNLEYVYKPNSNNLNTDTLESLCNQVKFRNRVKSNRNFDVDDVKMKTSIIGVVLGVILGAIGALSLTNDGFKVFYITVLFGIIGLIIGQPIGFIIFHIISGISMLVNPQKRQSFATSFINFIDDWARYVFYGLAILLVLLLFIYFIWGFDGIQTSLGVVGILLMFGFIQKYGPKKKRRR